MQLLTIVISRGQVFTLGEAYAFGVIWSFTFNSSRDARPALEIQRRTRLESARRISTSVRREIPVGLISVFMVLLSTAIVNLFTKSIATVSGIAFAAVFFVVFSVSERQNQRRHALSDRQMREHFQLQHEDTIGREALELRPGSLMVTMRDAANPFALKWALARTDTDEQDVVVLTARMVGAGGPEVLDASEQSFSEHEQMLFTKAVSVAESFGKHINLLVVPAGDIFAALVQTANSLEAATVVSGISSKMTAHEQAYYVGQAWEALPEPKRQFTFNVILEDGTAQSFHIGPHAPSLQPDDVQLVHRLWLNFRRDPELDTLHHSDIVTYALTRLATEYARDKQETLKGLKRSAKDVAPTRAFGNPRAAREGANDYNVLAPKPNADKTDISY